MNAETFAERIAVLLEASARKRVCAMKAIAQAQISYDARIERLTPGAYGAVNSREQRR